VVLCTGCLLSESYSIVDETTAAEATNQDDDRASKDPEPEDEAALQAEPEPEPAEPNPEPVVEPEPEPVPPEPDDILVDPVEISPEPSPAVAEPAASPDAVEPEPAPGAEDAGLPEPVAPTTPTPEPTPDVDASASCRPGAPGCVAMSGCGNAIVETGEACDGSDLAEASCHSQGYGGGTLHCSVDCEFDTSECSSSPECEAFTTGETGLVYEGNLNGKGNDVRSYSCSQGGRNSEDVTLAWTASRSGCYQITVDSVQAIDTIIGVFSDCSIDDELACDNEQSSFNAESILQFEAEANTSYAIAVDAYEPGDEATITVTIAPCLPNGWACLDARYGGGQGCDCGCGAFDPDCADETAAACENCGIPGACNADDCSDVDSSQNWLCDSTGPFGR
jgi:hypothetical protein